MAPRLRFGLFLAPYHPVGTSPTVALERDLALVQHVDGLGFDELWVGEHHSAGVEIIGCPEIFLAVAAERTRHLRLGTGVIGTSYHNPLWVAERIVLLDHLTRGRVMLGLGPGGLPTDGAMIGLEPADVRPLLEEGVRCITQLLTSDEPVTSTTKAWTLRDAALQLRPLQPDLEVALSAVASPTSPALAGRYGLGLLSIGATQPAGFEALAGHFDVWSQHAVASGHRADRDRWRMAGFLHLAETREQARREVEHGIVPWFRYFQSIAAVPQVDLGTAATVSEMIDYIIGSGLGVIGTVEDAVEQVQRLQDRSGGFGTYLSFAHEWADPAATRRSYELLAEHVLPRFQGQASRPIAAARRAAEARSRLFGEAIAAHEAAVARAQEGPRGGESLVQAGTSADKDGSG